MRPLDRGIDDDGRVNQLENTKTRLRRLFLVDVGRTVTMRTV